MSYDLKRLNEFQGCKGPLLLMILDGVGLGKKDDSDGVFMARTPCLDSLLNGELYVPLRAHGTAVGMPTDEDMGNSEVGHNTMGAGRIFEQGASLVKQSINDESIYKSSVWQSLTAPSIKGDKTLHFIGLLSDGNVHSHIDHLFAMIEQCAKEGVNKARIHILLDGRDVYEKSALDYIEKTEILLMKLNQQFNCDYQIASGGGRMITTMDRYNADWDIVKRGWDAHVLGKARMFSSAKEAVQTFYDEDKKVNDQFLPAFVIEDNGMPIGKMEDGDTAIFFNFRGDRAIELSMAFDQKDNFDKFDRASLPEVYFAGMMQYDGDLRIPKNYLVNPPKINGAVSEYMCAKEIKTFALSETQKYGHVTYFWNGNKSGYINKDLETYIEIPSDKIQFEKAPQMKAYEITEKTIELLRSGKYKFGRINFANGDMVGHTGDSKAIIEALEIVDKCMAKIIEVVNELNGITMILADHGNADEMFTVKNGNKIISTAHSLNLVPCALVDSNYHGEYKMARLNKPGLSSVAATLLNLLGFEKPQEYDPSLIEF